LGNDHPIASIQKYYAAELPQREYDPEKAKYHIKKAGMLDEKKRAGIYLEMQRIVRDEGAVVIPMFAEVVVAATDKLKFNHFASNSNLDGLKCSERWWFES